MMGCNTMELESVGDVLDLCVVVRGVRYSTLVWALGYFEACVVCGFWMDGYVCRGGGGG